MKVAKLFFRLAKAMFDLFSIAVLFVGAAAWVSVKFLARYAYEILFVLLLLRFIVFITFFLLILFGFKRR